MSRLAHLLKQVAPKHPHTPPLNRPRNMPKTGRTRLLAPTPRGPARPFTTLFRLLRPYAYFVTLAFVRPVRSLSLLVPAVVLKTNRHNQLVSPVTPTPVSTALLQVPPMIRSFRHQWHPTELVILLPIWLVAVPVSVLLGPLALKGTRQLRILKAHTELVET